MATAAAAVVAKARRDVISHFMAANAVSPELAVPFATDRRIERRAFDRFAAAKVLLPTPDGRYYLDVPTWDAYSKQQRRRIAILLVGLVLATVVAVVAVAVSR
ncbi:MAG: hypothetical protein K2P79_01745 [Sphingomonas sp.]|nr:hypothetical protein [Sphingomonas sp.]